MEKKFEVAYEKIEDILYLGIKEKVKFSIDLALPSGDVVVDIGFDGLIKGIEIFNASEFFSLDPEFLSKIKKAEFRAVYAPSYAAVTMSIAKEKQIIKNNLVIPYNKKLVLT